MYVKVFNMQCCDPMVVNVKKPFGVENVNIVKSRGRCVRMQANQLWLCCCNCIVGEIGTLLEAVLTRKMDPIGRHYVHTYIQIYACLNDLKFF